MIALTREGFTPAEAKEHQAKLEAKHHEEFWAEHPDLEPRHGDYPTVILKNFYEYYKKLGDRVYDEELGELFSAMMERYRVSTK